MIALKTPVTLIVNHSGSHKPNKRTRRAKTWMPIQTKYHETTHLLRSEIPKARIRVKVPKEIPRRRGYRWAGIMTWLKPYANLNHLLKESSTKLSPYAKRTRLNEMTRGDPASLFTFSMPMDFQLIREARLR
jgi:hypothetical protein